jgi:hypothetical protein
MPACQAKTRREEDNVPLGPYARAVLMSVPKILPLFIPEILSHPAIAGKAETLSVPPVGKPVGPREDER